MSQLVFLVVLLVTAKSQIEYCPTSNPDTSCSTQPTNTICCMDAGGYVGSFENECYFLCHNLGASTEKCGTCCRTSNNPCTGPAGQGVQCNEGPTGLAGSKLGYCSCDTTNGYNCVSDNDCTGTNEICYGGLVSSSTGNILKCGKCGEYIDSSACNIANGECKINTDCTQCSYCGDGTGYVCNSASAAGCGYCECNIYEGVYCDSNDGSECTSIPTAELALGLKYNTACVNTANGCNTCQYTLACDIVNKYCSADSQCATDEICTGASIAQTGEILNCGNCSQKATTTAAATSDITTSDITTSDITTSDITTSDITTSDITTSDITTSDISTSNNPNVQGNKANYKGIQFGIAFVLIISGWM